MLDGKLYYKKAKRTEQGTISNSNCNPDDHDRLCKVWFNSTFALCHSKLKEFEWAGGPELKLFAQKNNWRVIRAKHADKRSVSRLWNGGPCFALICFGLFYSYRLFLFKIFLPISRSLKHQLGKNSRPYQSFNNSLGNVSIQQLHCS